MKDQQELHINETIVPVGIGVTTYVAGRLLPFIPKELSIFKTVKSSQIIGGLVDGLGNVRNISATLMGVSTAILSQTIISKINGQYTIDKPIEHDVAHNNDSTTYHVNKLNHKHHKIEHNIVR